MGKLGADVDQLDQLAVNLDRAATRLEGNASIIDGHTRALWWSGSTADRFAASWASVDRRHLNTIAASMREAAESVRTNAQQQRLASESGGSIVLPDGFLGSIDFPGSDTQGAGDAGLELAGSIFMSAIAIVALFVPHPGFHYLAIVDGLHDLITETRDGAIGVVESIADILKIGHGVVGLIGGAIVGTLVVAAGIALAAGATAAAAAALAAAATALTVATIAALTLLAASVWIDVGIALYDNWEDLKDWAGDVWDDVADGASKLVSPVVDFVEGVVDVTERVGEAIGDAVSDIADVAEDVAEDVGSFITAPGRLVLGLF